MNIFKAIEEFEKILKSNVIADDIKPTKEDNKDLIELTENEKELLAKTIVNLYTNKLE